MTAVFVDLSVHQRGISWDALGAAGVRGALLKASEGVGFRDAAFERHRAEARRVGIPTGAYHYARPDTGRSPRDARSEAEWFLDVARPRAGGLLPALDFETPGLAPRALLEWALTWLECVGSAIGARPLFYTYTAFLRDRMARSPELAARSRLWLADWGANDGRWHVPPRPGPWRAVTLHQYTSRGVVPGVRARLDLSRLMPGSTLDSITLGPAATGGLPPAAVRCLIGKSGPQRGWLGPSRAPR